MNSINTQMALAFSFFFSFCFDCRAHLNMMQSPNELTQTTKTMTMPGKCDDDEHKNYYIEAEVVEKANDVHNFLLLLLLVSYFFSFVIRSQCNAMQNERFSFTSFGGSLIKCFN